MKKKQKWDHKTWTGHWKYMWHKMTRWDVAVMCCSVVIGIGIIGFGVWYAWWNHWDTTICKCEKCKNDRRNTKSR